MVDLIFESWKYQSNITILAKEHTDRLGVISFYIDDLHFNLGVKLLNDKFGIQTRGGCSCAGTYGHFLLSVNQETSNNLICQISTGDLMQKPGWIRLSIHPTTTTAELEYVCNSVKDLADNHQQWGKEYSYNSKTNEFIHQNALNLEKELVESWFD